MLRERESIISKISVIIQVLITLMCFSVVLWLEAGKKGFNEVLSNEFNYSVILISLIWFILLEKSGKGNLVRITSARDVFIGYFKVISIGVGLLVSLNIWLQYSVLNFLNIFLFSLLNLLLLNFYKHFLHVFIRFFRRRGFNNRHILVIADEKSEDYIDLIINNKDWGYRIWGIMTDSLHIQEKYEDNYKVIRPSKDLKDFLDHETIDEVIYCKSGLNQEEISKLIADCSEIGIGFHHKTVVSVQSSRIKPRVALFSQLPFISYQSTPDNYIALKAKSAFDFFFSLFVIIMTLPIYAIVAVIIKLDDGGPVFFKQERVGLNGRRFYCYKFRTMVTNAEALKAQLMGQNEQEGPVFKIAMDPRVTRIGRFLRKTSLDELPQFLNVLKGEMSVVGPRPPIPSEVKQYERWQIRRLSMKPGITCIWQVSGRNNIQFDEWMRLDMKYIDNWSIKLDFILVFKTIKVMLVGDGH